MMLRMVTHHAQDAAGYRLASIQRNAHAAIRAVCRRSCNGASHSECPSEVCQNCVRGLMLRRQRGTRRQRRLELRQRGC